MYACVCVNFSDDFLAFFENTVPPKIKGPAAKSKKPSANAAKVLWGDPASAVRYTEQNLQKDLCVH